MIYVPVKAISNCRSSYIVDHLASCDLKIGNFLIALYLRHFFNYFFDKKGFDS
jgi:hypothetical protein